MSARHDGEEEDYFDDLPIAKWLNNRPIGAVNDQHSFSDAQSTRNIEMDKNEIMCIASELNHCNLNLCSTSNTLSISSTTTDTTDNNESDHHSQTIEQLSIALQFWCIHTMKSYFSNWKNHSLHKLNILHIKYRNYQCIRHRKILFDYFKKWHILQQNYKSTILSLAYWAHCVQSNSFKAWQKYTFQTAPKSRVILCNRIKRYLSHWRHRTQRSHSLSNTRALIIHKRKSLQLNTAWNNWMLVHLYHAQMRKIQQRIMSRHWQQYIKYVFTIWRVMFERYRKLRQLKCRMICKRCYKWWQLQSSLSIHYKNTDSHSNYHSLDQSSRNAFAYWFTKRMHTLFKHWRHKQLHIQSLRSKSFECRQLHRDCTRKMYYKQWVVLYRTQTQQRYVVRETTKMIQHIAIRQYLAHWREYKNTQNIKRQKNLESQMLYVRNMSIKFYTFWKNEAKQCIHTRLTEEKADSFYRAKITSKHMQIVFGQWLLRSIQQKDTKHKIESKYERNMLKRYCSEWMVQLEYKQRIHRFQTRWNKTKYYDLYLKIFIVWKKQCKYQILLLHKKREIECNRRHKIFRVWYLTVYKRHKLNQCQVIATHCSIQSAFIRWKVTMKHHLRNKRNEIYLRQKHQNWQMMQTLVYWKRYIQHKQNIKCHVVQLNTICTVFMEQKCFKLWHHSYQLSLRFKSAKQQHTQHTLRTNIGYWLHYNRRRQKHQYMVHVAKDQRNKTLLINAVSYWNQFKCHRMTIDNQHTMANQFIRRKYVTYWKHNTMRNLSLKSRIDNLTTYLHTTHKSAALEWWMMQHLKQRQLCVIKSKIETQRQEQLFYRWMDKAEETKTLRLLNDHAIGLHKDKVLTQVFVSWTRLLPLLKREKVQLMKPRLIFNFYQWRKWSAENNNLRDKCYEVQLWKVKRCFCIYRAYAKGKNLQRKEAHSILNTVHNQHKRRIGCDMWRDMVAVQTQNQQKYDIIKHKQDTTTQSAIMNEWKLLYQVLIFAKTKQLSHCYKTWRQQYEYAQIEARVMHNIYYHGMKKHVLLEWKTLLRIKLDQRRGFEMMIRNTNTKHKAYFFAIWRTSYNVRRICIKLNRIDIGIKIMFWRTYASSKIKMRNDLRQLGIALTEKWRFYPSSIYQCNYSDDDEEDEITLSPLKSISIRLAPILAKRQEFRALKPSYKRPTTPTLLSIAKKPRGSSCYNESKDDMFMCNGDTRIEIASYNKLTNDTECWIKPTKKHIMRQIVLKWKHFDVFKVFKQWKCVVQIQKEELRLIKYAEYEFRQKSLEYAICTWKHRVTVHKSYHLLLNKQLREVWSIWCSVYKYCVVAKIHDENAALHYEKCSKMKCISYWNGIIRRRNKCDCALAKIASNTPIHKMRSTWNAWRRLFLFMHQIRNDNNNSDLYYYKLLTRNCYRTWHRSFTTRSIIHSLIDNTLIQHQTNTKRRVLCLWFQSIRHRKMLKEKMFDSIVYHELKTTQRAFKQWLIWYEAARANHNTALDIYTQNVFKHCFTNWKVQWIEKVRDLKLNESVLFYQALKAENERYETLLFWKYTTQSNKDLAIKELTFYHSHLLPNLFIAWKRNTQNKRMSSKYYYYNTLRKHIKHWKRFNKNRRRIMNDIEKNFNHMKMQRTKHQLNGWKRFALKCAQIHENATELITRRGGVALFSSNHLSSVSLHKGKRFEIIHNEARLLQSEAFDRWRFFYDRNQKLKYFFRLIRLERFVSEWKDHMALQNRNKYLMSKAPIIVRKTSMKKYFNLWIKTFKQDTKLRTLYCLVSNRQQFRLMKRIFLSFRDYIEKEKRKQFVLRRLMLCKYVKFWSNRATKQKEYRDKESALSAKYNSELQSQGLMHWKSVFKDRLVSFHLHQFELSFCRSYYVQKWRNMNRKHKMKLFRSDQLRQRMMRSLVKWKGFIATKQRVSQMEEIATDYYCLHMFRFVWNTWQQHLLTKYILIESQCVLRTFHVQFVIQKWRMNTESTQICRRAQNALNEHQQSKQLMESFEDWRSYCLAVRHYKQSLLHSALRQWVSMQMEIQYEKDERNAMRQIWLVWHHYTYNSIQYDAERVHRIQSMRLLKIFKLWIQTMKLKQYHVKQLMRKGLTAFKDHRKQKQLAQKQYEEAMDLNQHILMRNAMNIMFYQWFCVKRATAFNIQCLQFKCKQNCFDLWCNRFAERKKEEKRLRIAFLHWRQNQLDIVIRKWQLISRRGKQYKKYLRHAENKYKRRLAHAILVFWHSLFKQISNKKQALYGAQLRWNKKKRNGIFIAWNNTLRANCHYKLRKKVDCLQSWKLLYQYRVAAQHERDQNMNLLLNVFCKWNEFTSRIKQKQIKLSELCEVLTDWKREKAFGEWRQIYAKHVDATRLYAANLQKRVFAVYVKRIALIVCEKQKEIESSDRYCKRTTVSRCLCLWIKCYECAVKKNECLSSKCNEYLVRRRVKVMRFAFEEWLAMFDYEVNENRSIEVSRRYHNNYIASKVFVEWKLYVQTRAYKAKLITKSLTGLQLKSKSLSHKRISLSHSYIRLSNNQQSFASMFNNDDYDSVLLQTSNMNDTYYD